MPEPRSPLHISDEFSLPVNAVTEKLAAIGRTGSGKSYAAKKLAEQMFYRGAQIVALDPVGVWWGLRVDSTGEGPGIPIPVFGGLHGDVPLDPGSGRVIADLIVDRRLSAVLDVSQIESDSGKARFAHDFGDRLYFRKKAAPSAMHLFLEEAQEFVPQNPQREEALMLHVFTRMWKLGRNFGIGGTLISQRPQEVNKKVLNQTELLMAFQMTGPQERKAIEAWVSEKGISEDIGAILPKLRRGAPHIWSPSWLKVSKVIEIAKLSTFDTSQTPKVDAFGDAAPEWTPPVADVDLEEISAAVAATIEKAKAEDPKHLRARVAELERALAAAKREAEAAAQRPAVQKVPPEFLQTMELLIDNITEGLDAAAAGASRIRIGLEKINSPVSAPAAAAAPVRKIQHQRSDFRAAAPAAGPGEKLPKAQRAILTVLAEQGAPCTRRKVAIASGYAISGGGFKNAISALRVGGLISGSNVLHITEAGKAALGPFEPLPVGRDLLEHWCRELPKAERLILTTIYEQGPGATFTKESLARSTNYEADGGGFKNALSRLRTLELIERGYPIRGSEDLFA